MIVSVGLEKFSQARTLRKNMFAKTVETCSRMFSVQIS